EYCRRMYGPAATTMRQLIALQIDGWEKSRWPGGRLSAKAIHEISYPRKTVLRMEALRREARRQAGKDALLVERVDCYRQPFAEFFQESKDYAEGSGIRPLIAQKVGENPVID